MQTAVFLRRQLYPQSVELGTLHHPPWLLGYHSPWALEQHPPFPLEASTCQHHLEASEGGKFPLL